MSRHLLCFRCLLMPRKEGDAVTQAVLSGGVVDVGAGCCCGSSAVLGAVAEPAAPHRPSGSSTSSPSGLRLGSLHPDLGSLHPDLGFVPVPPQFVPQFPQDQVETPRPPPLPWALSDPSWPYKHHPLCSFCCYRLYLLHTFQGA